MALFIQTENKKRLENLRNRTPHKLLQTALFVHTYTISPTHGFVR